LDLFGLLYPSFGGLKRSQIGFYIDYGHVNSFTNRNELLCPSRIDHCHDVCLWHGLRRHQICMLFIPFGTFARKTVNPSWNRFKFMGLHSSSPLYHLLLADFKELALVRDYFC
jgi:hypothetical protein